MKGIINDITWCASECKNTICFRNIANKNKDINIYSVAYFKDTDTCKNSKEMSEAYQKMNFGGGQYV